MDTVEQLAIQKMLSSIDTYRASAMHLSVGNPPMMRVSGKLVPIPDQPILTPSFMEHLVPTWLDETATEHLRTEKDVTIARTLENKKRFRISVFYQQGYVSASLTLIPSVIPSLQQLGLSEAAQSLATVPSGLVLIVGPFGSHRSLTLASCIEHLNQTVQKRIVTIEQPVEYLFTDNRCVIDQREVGVDLHSVAGGLEFALEEDVDIVAVSELDTKESYERALQLANGGKTVFAVMNTKSVVTSLNMIIHSFEGADQERIRSELASGIVGIINQREVYTTAGDKRILAEVMIPDDSIRTIIRNGDVFQINNVLYNSREPGLRGLDTVLREAIAQNVITKAEALVHATDPSTF